MPLARATLHNPNPNHNSAPTATWYMVFLSRAIASQHNIPYAIRQTLETPSACHPHGDIVLRKIFDSLCSQCHSATLEHHPSTSPPTTRYLETIRFTDLLTLKLAAAQLCSAWHGLSLGSPSFSTRKHFRLDYFAFGPPSDHHQRHACRALQSNIATVNIFAVQCADVNTRAPHPLHCPQLPNQLMYLISLSATRGAPLGIQL